MTQITTGQPEPPSQPPALKRAATGAQRSMLRRVLGELVLYWSARIGLVWVAVLTVLAVFAPFFASSHPILMKTAEAESPGERLTVLTRYEPGSWSSPLLQHLTVADVLLPVVLFGALAVVFWRGVGGGRKLLAFMTFAGLVVVLGLWREQLWPFVTGGHETWWRDWQDWRGDVERVAGVPPRAPVGPFAWWVMLWVGLVLMVTVSALATAGTVMSVAGQAGRPQTFWPIAGATVAGTALWVGLVVWLGLAVWLAGLVLGVAGVVLAVVYRHDVPGRALGATALVSALLIGGWLVHAPVSPPRLTIFEQYRDAAEAGEIEWALHPPVPYSPDDRLRDQRGMRFQPPDSDHILGTTQFSADLAANMIHGTRIALSVGFISTGIAIAIGIVIGGLMGYFSGIVDLLGMRLVEMFSAIPTLFLLLAFVAAFGANLYIIMIIIGLTGWVGYAVFIRAEFLRLRQQEFIQAAQALGLPLWSIIFRHLLPNGVAPVLVAASFGVASAIGYEATLSFLGIGLDTEASWGLLLDQALRGGAFNWWIAVTPGLAIFLTVFAYILIGEALRDAIDPKTQLRNT
ncbi:MAG: ABC transporter permease [Phycisphaeraceae bacterium]